MTGTRTLAARLLRGLLIQGRRGPLPGATSPTALSMT
ncbi:hypothetical protein Ga0074812_103230 [Parafrankia irregularis]|uniref:Uncharacterized protein n=1 Tax=Parafrankia irregularis TaxID=795642 RepID=A0A0S4QGT9_9ACTN|nr:hypothetical protein Ga0074812_103230 [Parafrankia irregularis]